MKIYEIGTGYTPIPAQLGAATEIVVEELTKAFLKKNANAEIIDVSADNRAVNSLPINEVKVPAFFTKNDVNLGIVHKIKRVVYSVFLAFYLKKHIKDEKEKAVLHFHNQYNLFFFLKLAGKSCRKKVYIAYTNHNGLWNLPWENVKHILRKKYFQEIVAMKNADLIFVLNENTRKNITEKLGISYEKTVKIANGVNTDLYHPLSEQEIASVKNRYNLSNKRVILQVGSINENKGQGRAIELLVPLLKSDSNLIYAYAGEIVSNDYFEKIKNIAAANEVSSQTVYLGAVSPGTQVNELYNIADVLVVMSKYEAFSLVSIESLSAGNPVVICSENFLKLGAGNLECSNKDFLNNVKDILHGGADLRVLSRKTAIENYSWDIIAEKHLDLFKSIAE